MSGALTSGRKRLSAWMKSVGPSLVYILTVLGAGDIISNATAGASYGYSLIWALGMTLVFRFVWVNTSAKYVLVTGESLLTGYGRVGRWVIWIVLVALILFRHFYNLFLILMIGNSAHLLFPLPTEWSASIWAFLFTLVGFAMMFWGGYPMIETFCKILVGALGAALLVAAMLARPDPRAILEGLLIPSLPQAQGLYTALLVVMALIGTEAGSMTNLTYAYFIHERGWKDVSFLKKQRFDLAVGVICMFLMGALLQIAAAATIHPLGLRIEGAEDLVGIFTETQGLLGLIIFGLGLWGASFSTFIGGNTGGALILTDICRSFIGRFHKSTAVRDKEITKNDPIYRWSIILWSFSPLYIIFTGVRPVWLVLTVNSLVVVAIPVLALTLLKITSDPKLMGDHKNGWITNLVMVLLVLVSIYFTYRNGLELWNSLV